MAVQDVSGKGYNRSMTTTYKPYTISELVNEIYEDNLLHFEFMENMSGGDCDCHLHYAMNLIVRYWGD